jgi:SpoVK/Ycf46/Vps4 family AAA+-type ATPase
LIWSKLLTTSVPEISGMRFQNEFNDSGADLSALIRQAAILSLKEILLATDPTNAMTRGGDVTVGMDHFDEAFGSVRPSVSDQDRRRYEHLRTVFAVAP